MKRLVAWLRVALIDLRGSAGRFVILIACLALGVAAIGTVSSLRNAVETAITRDARTILGGDLELRSRRSDIAPDVAAALEQLGTVNREVALNTQAKKGAQSAFLSLRGVGSGYPLVGSVVLLPGAMPGTTSEQLSAQDGTFGLLLSQQAALRLGAQVGDLVQIGTLDVQLRGIIDTLPDQATLGFQLGAPALIAEAALPLAGLKQEGVLSQFRYKVMLHGVDFATAEARLKQQFPDADFEIRSPAEATETIARFIGIFGNFMLLVALSSMVVGGLGAANAVTAYVGERQSAIATMRSLGASGNRITVHFLAQVVALSLVSIAIGLVAVVVGTFALLPLLANLTGLDLRAVLDLGALSAAAGIGLVIALVFAWLPLLRARAIRPALLFRAGGSSNLERMRWRSWVAPAAALPLLAGFALLFLLTLAIAGDPRLIAIYFAGALLAFVLLRLAAALLIMVLSRVPPPRNKLLRLALSAIVRPGAPTSTVLVSLGMGLSLLLLIVTTQFNINAQIDTQVANEAPAFILLDLDKASIAQLQSFVDKSSDIEKLTTTPMLRGTITAINGAPPPEQSALNEDIAPVFRGDTSLTWSADEPKGTVIEQGAWWPADYSGDPEVSVSSDLRDGLGLKLGDTITIAIAGRPITMQIASFRQFDPRGPELNFRLIVSPGLIEKAPQSAFGALMVKPGTDSEVEAALIAAFPELNFVPVGDTLARVRAVFDGLTNAIALVSGTAVLSGILVLAGALSVGRQQREADAVVMKVLGARRRDVITAFLIEYALLGAIASVLASGIALLGAWMATSLLLQIGFVVPFAQLALVAAAVIAVTVLTGAATTWSAMTVPTARRLRAEAI